LKFLKIGWISSSGKERQTDPNFHYLIGFPQTISPLYKLLQAEPLPNLAKKEAFLDVFV
jgi:hypothetical protein